MGCSHGFLICKNNDKNLFPFHFVSVRGDDEYEYIRCLYMEIVVVNLPFGKMGSVFIFRSLTFEVNVN